MNRLQATSRCECQAILTAVLDERRQVSAGKATRLGATATAPAHTIGAERENFDIGWLCPFCGRNTLRSFHAGALRVLPEGAASDPKPPAPSSP
jgi:hypothetical protein